MRDREEEAAPAEAGDRGEVRRVRGPVQPSQAEAQLSDLRRGKFLLIKSHFITCSFNTETSKNIIFYPKYFPLLHYLVQ